MGESNKDQPRQPKDLEGLLKFCIQTTSSEDAKNDGESSEPLSSERLQWLQEAIKGMSVDVVQELLQGLQILNKPCVYDINAPECELKEVELAFEVILDRIGCIDMGNNFHKIGGSDVLKRCIINSPHSIIKWNAANIIAELSQCNPYCQEHFVKEGFLPLLINLLVKSSSKEEMCSLKAIYAISCIIRHNMKGIDLFISLSGPKSIVEFAILPQKSSKRLLIKACFFIAAICEQSNAAIIAFSETGLTRKLVILLIHERNLEAHEYIAKALLCLMKEKSNRNEWKDFTDELKIHMETRKNLLAGKQEHEEELGYYKEIETIIDSRDIRLTEKCVAS